MYEPTRDRNTDRSTHNYNTDNRVEEDIYEKLLLLFFLFYIVDNYEYYIQVFLLFLYEY